MKKIGILSVLIVFLMIFSAGLVKGLPGFAAQVEQKCNLCHVDPTGGGMRNSFGSQYFAQTEMAMKKASLEDVTRFKPQISDNISIGMDMRTLYHYDNETKQSTLFQMEGNLYLTAQLDQQFSLTLDKGLYSGFQVFGVGYFLPFHGYAKVGKFQPAYGWRFADHTSFVRERMLWPPSTYDTGVEVGFHPQGISATFGMFNGSSLMLDADKGKAGSARLEFRRNIRGFGFGLGGSYYRNDTPNGAIDMYGPFWYTKFGRIIYLGELDWLDNAAGTVSLATTQDLAFIIRQGFWLRAIFDYHDPDVDFKTGALARYGIASQSFPFAFLEITPHLWLYESTDPAGNKDRYVVYDGQIHFFF